MNIFARELQALLEEHEKSLGSLYTLHSDLYHISPHKITRLKKSLEHDLTATLNAEELSLLAAFLGVDSDGPEILRLRAALLAENVRHLLGGRMDRDQALELGEITFRLLQGQEPEELLALRDLLLGGTRLDPSVEENRQAEPLNDQIEQALEPAVKAYEEGAMWLEVARETRERTTRLGYLAQARALLDRAKDLATQTATIAIGTTQQQEWLAIIAATLQEATLLR